MHPTTYTIQNQQSTEFEMIIESELPVIAEEPEEMNKSVAPREITTEAMLVDDEVNQPTMILSSENELSTPERLT